MSAFSAYNVKKHKAHTPRTGQRRSHIFEYAYGEIEKEKMREKTHLTLTEVIEKAGLYGVQTRPKIEVSFKDLSLTLKGNGKKILRNVTGKLLPGRIAAVMGPSGAGKTTFLNALAGKATGLCCDRFCVY
jgi:ABC-type multidrug transport system fused ATPase/permease subunit